MSEVLSLAEIEERYPNEWVLLGYPETDQNLNVLGGTLLFHSKDRDEVHQKAIELTDVRHIACLYIGSPPPDMAFAL